MKIVSLFMALFAACGLGAAFYFSYLEYLKAKQRELVTGIKGVMFQVLPNLEAVYGPVEKKARMMRLLEQFTAAAPSGFQKYKTIMPTYSFEIHASGNGGYGTYIWVPESEAQYIPAKIRSMYEQPVRVKDEDEPIALLRKAFSDNEGEPKEGELFVAEYQTAAPSYLPIKEWFPGRSDPEDPTEQLYGIFDALRGNNVAGFMLILKPADQEWRSNGMAHVHEMVYGPQQKKSILKQIVKPAEEAPAKPAKLDPFQKDEHDKVINKLKQDAFAAVIRIYSTDRAIFELLQNAIEKRFRGDLNSFIMARSTVPFDELEKRWFYESSTVLSIGEAASVFHFPDAETKAERLQRGGSKTAVPDEDLVVVPDGIGDLFDYLS